MILEEQHQSPEGSNGAIIVTPVSSSNDDDNLSSVQVHREENDEATDRNNSLAVVQQPSATGYNNQLVTTNSTSSEYDDDDDSSSGSSVAEDEDIPMDELGQRGWIEKRRLGSEVNGVALPGSDAIQIGKIHATNTPNMHIGQRVFIKSKGDVIIKSVNYSAPITPDDQKQALENGSIDSDKDKDGISNFGSTVGPKLSTATDTSDNPLYPSPHGRVAEWCLTRRCTIIICITALVLLLITLLAVLLSNSGTTNATIPPYNPASPNDTSINNDDDDNQLFVQRFQWGGKQPRHAAQPLRVHPPEKVIIYHTVTGFCTTKRECSEIVRSIQEFHMDEQDYGDIGYNFLIGGDGRVYVGRGWGVVGAHTYGQNSISIGVAFIGDYRYRSPTPQQVDAAKKLFDIGVQEKELAENYKVLGHRQVAVTASPGDKLYNVMTTWQHWSPDP